MKKPLSVVFNQSTVPTICCINKAKTPLGVNFRKLVATLQVFADQHFTPVWGTPCKIKISKDGRIPKGQWGLVFLDDADPAGDLGYHDLTRSGFPLSKIFVRTTLHNGGKVSVTASHELAEMLVDPGTQLGAVNAHGVWYAYEAADAVESEQFNVNGIPMSNFVYPAWFEAFHKARSTSFDHLGTCRKPFELRPGGYLPIFKKGRWTQIFGSKKAAQGFKQEHHHRTRRRIQSKGSVLGKGQRSHPNTEC